VQKSIIIGARPGLFDASRRAGGGGAAAAAEEEDGVSLGELSREEPGLGDRGGLRAVGFAIATWGADFLVLVLEAAGSVLMSLRGGAEGAGVLLMRFFPIVLILFIWL